MSGNFFRQALEGIVAVAQANNPGQRDGDYTGEDGLLWCGKCHTPKQVRSPLNGQLIPCLCDCEAKALEAQERAERRARWENRLAEMRRAGIYNPEYRKMTFERDDGKNATVSSLCRSYVQNWEQMERDNAGLLLYGNTGTGKTFMACCIANALIDRGIGALVTTMDRLIGAMRENYEANKADILERIQSIPLLVLDDLGRERSTEYVCEKIDEIVDARYTAGRPTIVTTNKTMEAMKEPQEQLKRAYDRLLEMCAPVAVVGGSRRQEIGARKREAIMAMMRQEEQ